MQGMLDDQVALEAELGQPVCFEFGDTTAGSVKVTGTMLVDFRVDMSSVAKLHALAVSRRPAAFNERAEGTTLIRCGSEWVISTPSGQTDFAKTAV